MRRNGSWIWSEGSGASPWSEGSGVSPSDSGSDKSETWRRSWCFHDECPLCYSCPMMQPVATTCNHLFCQRCIETHLDAATACPVCAQELTLHRTPSQEIKEGRRSLNVSFTLGATVCVIIYLAWLVAGNGDPISLVTTEAIKFMAAAAATVTVAQILGFGRQLRVAVFLVAIWLTIKTGSGSRYPGWIGVLVTGTEQCIFHGRCLVPGGDPATSGDWRPMPTANIEH